jgi:hypothetical protein
MGEATEAYYPTPQEAAAAMQRFMEETATLLSQRRTG